MRLGTAILVSMLILSGCSAQGNRAEQVTNPTMKPPAVNSPEMDLRTKLKEAQLATPRWRHTLPPRHFVYSTPWTDQLLYLEAPIGAPYQLQRLNRDGQLVKLYSFPELAQQTDSHVLVRVDEGADGSVAIVNPNWELILLDPSGKPSTAEVLDQDYQPIWFDGGRELMLKSSPLLTAAKVVESTGRPVGSVLAPGDNLGVDPRDLVIAVDPLSPWILVGRKDQLELRDKEGKLIWQGRVSRPPNIAATTERGELWLLRRSSASGPSEVQLTGPHGEWTYQTGESEPIVGGLVAPQSGVTWLVQRSKVGGASTLTTLTAQGQVSATWRVPESQIALHGVARDGSWALVEVCDAKPKCGKFYVIEHEGHARWQFAVESIDHVSISWDGGGLLIVTDTEILAFDV